MQINIVDLPLLLEFNVHRNFIFAFIIDCCQQHRYFINIQFQLISISFSSIHTLQMFRKQARAIKYIRSPKFVHFIFTVQSTIATKQIHTGKLPSEHKGG